MNKQPETRRKMLLLLLSLFTAGLAVYGLLALLLKAPGYMDAEYYYLGGLNLFSGRGFQEMILWNYLDDPHGLPNPSHGYWMPLPSLLAAAGMTLFGRSGFLAAQASFILLAACLPPLTYWTAYRLHREHTQALLAALLAFFPGYYQIYLVTTDGVAPYMLLGGLFTLALISPCRKENTARHQGWRFIGLGLVAGLMHLTRSDGILWLAGALLAAFWMAPEGKAASDKKRSVLDRLGAAAVPASIVLIGYLLVMLPWFVRNLHAFGRPLAPGGFLTLWLQNYNQTFIYPASQLTLAHWMQAGVGVQLLIRLKAAGENLVSLLAVQGEILLFPLLVVGAVRLRRARTLHVLGTIWSLIFVLMSFLFPFAGARGGFLHAAAGFQVIVWVLAPVGFRTLIEWGVKKRGWDGASSGRVFSGMLVGLLALMSLFLFLSKIGIGEKEGPWQSSWKAYARLEATVETTFPDKADVVMINNPPGYTLAAGGRPAIVIPYGDEQTVLAVARRYHARLLAVDRNTIPALRPLYDEPATRPGLTYLYAVDDFRLYAFDLETSP